MVGIGRWASVLYLSLASAGVAPAQEMDVFSVGSGDITGSYYAAARAICGVFNLRNHDALRCSPEPTSGSIYNLKMLREGELDFAFTQSDWQSAALGGDSVFAKAGPMEDLRSVITLFPESVTVLASSQSTLRSASDLAGKVVDIGLPTSGRNATLRVLFGELGIDTAQFAGLREYEPSQSVQELCANRIDAAIFVVGHPNALIANAIDDCGARIVPFDGAGATAIAARSTDYAIVRIPADTYTGQTEDIRTLSVFATLVTRADVSDTLVVALLRTILDNFDELARSSPLLADIEANIRTHQGLSAPLHPAAKATLEAAGFRR